MELFRRVALRKPPANGQRRGSLEPTPEHMTVQSDLPSQTASAEMGRPRSLDVFALSPSDCNDLHKLARRYALCLGAVGVSWVERCARGRSRTGEHMWGNQMRSEGDSGGNGNDHTGDRKSTR